MIAQKYCIDCHKPLKTKNSVRCLTCTAKHRQKQQNRDWNTIEETALIAYSQICAEIIQQKKQLEETRNTARTLRQTITKRHTPHSIHNKMWLLQEKGVIKREVHSFVKT
jgi:leucyl aminopeptidase